MGLIRVLAAAAKRCREAEDMFESGQNEQKRQWAKAQTAKDLKRQGVEERYIDELVSLGLLVVMRHAVIMTAGEEAPKGEKVAKDNILVQPAQLPAQQLSRPIVLDQEGLGESNAVVLHPPRTVLASPPEVRLSPEGTTSTPLPCVVTARTTAD